MPISNKTRIRLDKSDYNNSIRLNQVGNFIIQNKKTKGVKEICAHIKIMICSK